MPWVDRTFALPRVALHARQLEAGGATLVLLHGLSADGSVWQGVGRRLSPPFTLLAPDLRGHGLSGHPETGYRATDYAEDIAGLIDTLTGDAEAPSVAMPPLVDLPDRSREGIVLQRPPNPPATPQGNLRDHSLGARTATGSKPPTVDLLGHSLGAIAALGAAALRPGSVRRLVLVDPPLDGPRTLPAFLQRMLDARHRADDGAIRGLILEQTPGLSETLLRAYERIWSRVADGALESVVSEGDRAFADVTTWYPHVQAPTLILRADEHLDAACSPAAAARAVATLPDARAITVIGASHNIHAVKPVEFARHVLAFLQST